MQNLEQNPPYIRYPGCEAASINQEIMAQLGSGSYAKWISVIRKEYAKGYDQVSQTLQAIKELGLVDDKYFPDELWHPYTRLKDLPKEVTERAFKVAMDYQYIPFNILNTVVKYTHLISVIPVFDSFRNVGKDGIVKGLKYINPSRHCMVLTERTQKNNLQVYSYLNSYGYDWGDNGYVYFPTGYINKFREGELFYTFHIEKL